MFSVLISIFAQKSREDVDLQFRQEANRHPRRVASVNTRHPGEPSFWGGPPPTTSELACKTSGGTSLSGVAGSVSTTSVTWFLQKG